MDWMVTVITPLINPIFVGLIRTPAEERDSAAIAAAAKNQAAAWRILDAHLAATPFAAGAALS